MKEQVKEIIFSVLNIAVLFVIFTGLSDPVDGAIVAIIITAVILSMAYFPIGKFFVLIYLDALGIEKSEDTLSFLENFGY